MEKKRKIRNWIAGILVLALAAGMVALPTLLRSRQGEPEDKASYLSAQAERKTIRSTISGGGTLTQQEGTAIRVLKGVEISEYLVNNGDRVEKGQTLAVVDPVSVMKTISTLQANLDYISRQLQQNPARTGTDAIFLPAAGRVKEIYAQVGDKVTDVMARYGCLAVVSLDGLMAVETDTENPAEPGEDVTVKLSGGQQLTGRVEVRQGGHLTVTLTDEGTKLGEGAEVFNAAGESLGSGTLYVHSAWNVTAISGEITYVAVKPERTLPMNGHLFNLKNVDFSEKNRQLSEQRREYEEAMNKLFALRENGAVTAPADGCVYGIDKTKVGLLRAGEPEYRLVFLSESDQEPSVPSPEKDKPGKYKNHSAAVVGITFGSITFMVEKEARKVKDYKNAPEFAAKKTKTVSLTSFKDVPIYSLSNSGKKWKSIQPDALNYGDILYFAYNSKGDLKMIIRSKQPEEEGGDGGGGGGYVPEQFEMYELTETELLQVVPQDTMTVQVSIDELDILSVALGQEAEITVDALPGRAYVGTVSQIDPIGKNSGGNTRYTITISIDKDDNMLQGMNATAILTVGVTEDVLTIPAAALDQRGSHSYVYRGFDSERRQLLEPVEVELGVSDGQTVEIRSGLSEGDTVWYSYYETEAIPMLFAGQPTDDM